LVVAREKFVSRCGKYLVTGGSGYSELPADNGYLLTGLFLRHIADTEAFKLF
jgi:hypothetical protein